MNPDSQVTQTQPNNSAFLNALNFAKQNPDSSFATELRRRIQSGEMNDQLKSAGIDSSKFQPQTQTPVQNSAPTSQDASPLGQIKQAGSDLIDKTKEHAAAITQDLSEKPSLAGASDVIGHVAGEAGDILGKLFSLGYEATTPQPIKDLISKASQALVSNHAVNDAGASVAKILDKFQVQHPDLYKTIAGLGQGAALAVGANEGPTASEAANIAKGVAKTGGQVISDAVYGATDLIPKVAKTDSATAEAIANIAKQEGGIVAPAKTASQLAEEAQQKTWDVIKPKLTPGEMSDAAASGRIARTGETGVVTQVPTKADLADIKLAQPYVEAANGDPIKAIANIRQGIADEAAKLREAVGTQGGTFSVSNVKGAINDVKVPLAIKDSAEMTQVDNIKNYVAELAKGVDKNPTGALDLSQKFRQGINSEFGENIWGKDTPISNYIKNVNKALNDFISTRLPEGTLPDGTLIKDSFAKQSQLYNIMDNIQLPNLGEAAINPTPEAPLKVPGSPLGEAAKKFGKEHPIIKGAAKAAGRAAGIGAGVHLIP